MKRILLILALFVSALGHSQEEDRISITGSVSVPVGDDPEGIIVTNLTSNTITITDERGRFEIQVALNDRIHFSALQFEEFTVTVDEHVISAKELNVFINAITTELPEVVVRPFDLSGNVEVDIRRIPVVEPNIPEMDSEDIVYNPNINFKPDSIDSPENITMRNSFMQNGLNFANIFRAIISSREGGDEDLGSLNDEIRDLYGDEFFLENLDIERHQINDFILYAEDVGLTEEMLKDGNEMQLIEFLVLQSENFKARTTAE